MSVDLKFRLAQSVRSYLDAPVPGSEDQYKTLNDICLTLEWLLCELLALDERGRWDWIDRVLDDMVTVEAPDRLFIEGRAIWYNEGASDYFEPFFPALRVSQNVDALVDYVIKVGDADRGLVKDRPEPRRANPSSSRRGLKLT